MSSEALPAGWSLKRCSESGRTYYHHAGTDKVTREIPTWRILNTAGSVVDTNTAAAIAAVSKSSIGDGRLRKEKITNAQVPRDSQKNGIMLIALPNTWSSPSYSKRPKKEPPDLPPQLRQTHQCESDMIGKGAFTTVWQLKHKMTGESYALKVVDKSPLHARNLLSQLSRGLRIQGQLQHRHILQLISCIQDATHVYMVLEHCTGGSLRTLCSQQPNNRLEEAVAARYFAQICKGVNLMHQYSYVHRGLKPENVLLNKDDEVRICDFGWSVEVGARVDLGDLDTPHRWPPELFESKILDVAIDLWALGTLSYELLVGHAAFWGNMHEIRSKVLSLNIYYPPSLSSGANSVLSGLMQLSPKDRTTTGELLEKNPWVQWGLGFARCCTNEAPNTLPTTAAPVAARGVTSIQTEKITARGLVAVSLETSVWPSIAASPVTRNQLSTADVIGLQQDSSSSSEEEMPTLCYSGDVSCGSHSDSTPESSPQIASVRPAFGPASQTSDSDREPYQPTTSREILISQVKALQQQVSNYLKNEHMVAIESTACDAQPEKLDNRNIETSASSSQKVSKYATTCNSSSDQETPPFSARVGTIYTPQPDSGLSSAPELSSRTSTAKADFDESSSAAESMCRVIESGASESGSLGETSDSDRESHGARLASVGKTSSDLRPEKLENRVKPSSSMSRPATTYCSTSKPSNSCSSDAWSSDHTDDSNRGRRNAEKSLIKNVQLLTLSSKSHGDPLVPADNESDSSLTRQSEANVIEKRGSDSESIPETEDSDRPQRSNKTVVLPRASRKIQKAAPPSRGSLDYSSNSCSTSRSGGSTPPDVQTLVITTKAATDVTSGNLENCMEVDVSESADMPAIAENALSYNADRLELSMKLVKAFQEASVRPEVQKCADDFFKLQAQLTKLNAGLQEMGEHIKFPIEEASSYSNEGPNSSRA